jgi:hypothetical protein
VAVDPAKPREQVCAQVLLPSHGSSLGPKSAVGEPVPAQATYLRHLGTAPRGEIANADGVYPSVRGFLELRERRHQWGDKVGLSAAVGQWRNPVYGGTRDEAGDDVPLGIEADQLLDEWPLAGLRQHETDVGRKLSGVEADVSERCGATERRHPEHLAAAEPDRDLRGPSNNRADDVRRQLVRGRAKSCSPIATWGDGISPIPQRERQR